MNNNFKNNHHLSTSSQVTEDYLKLIDPNILESFSDQQKIEITRLINKLIAPATPKLVDIRFTVDLIVTRYFVVLLLGKDRRRKKRNPIPEKVSKVGNIITATIILISLNLFIIGTILLSLYFLKSVVGINFFSGHISDTVEDIFKDK